MYFLNQTSFEVSTKQGPGFDVMFDNAKSLSKLLTLSQVSQLGIEIFGKPFKSGMEKTIACQSIVEHIKKYGAPEEKPGATKSPEQFQEPGKETKDTEKAPKKPDKLSKKSRSKGTGKKEKDIKTSKKGLKRQTNKKPDKLPKDKAGKQAQETPKKGKRGRKTPIYTLTTGKDLPYRFKTPENKREILVNNHAWALLEGIEALIKANGEGCQATAEQIVEKARETRLFRIHGTNETAKRLMTRWHKCLKYNGWLNP